MNPSNESNENKAKSIKASPISPISYNKYVQDARNVRQIIARSWLEFQKLKASIQRSETYSTYVCMVGSPTSYDTGD